MKMNYESPQAEIICFASLEQLASLNVELGDLEGNLGVASKDF